MSCVMLRKYCWKKAFETLSSALAKLLTTSRQTGMTREKCVLESVKVICVRFKPVSAMSRIVCLIAHIILSMNILNCAGGRLSNAA